MNETYLAHYGVKGMKWGIRRYQKKDGTLTRLGKKHQQRALEKVRKDKNFNEYNKDRKQSEFDDATSRRRGHEGSANPIMETETSAAKWLIHAYKNLKTSELLEEAYQNGAIQVGEDYVTDRAGNIILTESGTLKTQTIKDKAVSIVKNNNKEIIDKYIDEPKRNRERLEASWDLGDKYAQEIRDKINSKTYATLKDKEAAIDKAFKKKLEEVDKTGDMVAGDRLWQQWGFALDELKESNNSRRT